MAILFLLWLPWLLWYLSTREVETWSQRDFCLKTTPLTKEARLGCYNFFFLFTRRRQTKTLWQHLYNFLNFLLAFVYFYTNLPSLRLKKLSKKLSKKENPDVIHPKIFQRRCHFFKTSLINDAFPLRLAMKWPLCFFSQRKFAKAFVIFCGQRKFSLWA